MKRTWLVLVVAAISPLAALAQQAAQPETNPISNYTRQIVAGQAKNLIGAADEMPADKYTFQPTPAQMTFAHMIAHIAGTNNFLCSKISGVPAPTTDKLADTDPKDKLVSGLKASFDFCTSALAKVDDSNLGEVLTLYGTRTVSRGGAMIMLTDDFYDHYSMAAIYLRLNGLLPPSAKKDK
jgi:DinB superfamily